VRAEGSRLSAWYTPAVICAHSRLAISWYRKALDD